MRVTTLERGALSPPEVEALEASRTVADAWGVQAVRPCVSLIFLQGASKGEGRQPLAHLLGVEMNDLGLPAEMIELLLREWNDRVSPPLPIAEVRKVVRRFDRPGTWPYSCKHSALAVYCIGESCPYRSSKGLWRLSDVSANGLTCSDWLPLLNGSEVRVWLGLYRLAHLKGRGPRASIPFTFRELEQHSGVGRGHFRETLERLNHKGLIAELYVSNEKGSHSTFKFPPVLPPSGPYINKGGK